MTMLQAMRTLLGTFATLTLLMTVAPAVAAERSSDRPPVPVVRVDKQCRTGHNPNCHEVFVSKMVGDFYRPVGIWVKFTPKGR